MSDDESSSEHDVSTEDGSCVDSLDEWGWDPFVDQFLLETVGEAPRRGPVIDFDWVAEQFLETLEPQEHQIESALERFSPAALQERWLYLLHLQHDSLQQRDGLQSQSHVRVQEVQRQLHDQQRFERAEQRNIPHTEPEALPAEQGIVPHAKPDAVQTAQVDVLHTEHQASHVGTETVTEKDDEESSASMVDAQRCMDAGSSSAPCRSAQHASLDALPARARPKQRPMKGVASLNGERILGGGRPQKDRVLEAMQRFFMGRPSPEKGPVVTADPPAASAAPATSAHEDNESKAAVLVSDAEAEQESGQVKAAMADHSGPTTGDGDSQKVSSASVGTADVDEACAMAARAVRHGEAYSLRSLHRDTSNEAFRQCLDELQWHGEALRRCAAGEDAAALCLEATERRRLLLYSLAGVPQ